VVPTEFISSSLFVVQATKMTYDESIATKVTELMQLDEAIFLSYFHHIVEKDCLKVWYDQHIKIKLFAQGDKVLLYHSKYQKHHGKLQNHWLGSFIIVEVHES
jgi:hypothetical protein